MINKRVYHLFIFILSIVCSSSLLSQTNIQTNNVPSSLVSCGKSDTVTLRILTVPTVNNIRLRANLNGSFQFSDLIPDPNISIIDTSDLNLPYFQFSTISAASVVEIKFLIKANCNSNSKSISFNLYDGANNSISSTTTSSLINVDEPNIILSGIENTNSGNQTGINLSQLVVGDKYRRAFKIDYSSLVGELDSITVLVEKSFHDITWNSNNSVAITPSGDSAYYTFKTADFGGSSLSPTNNSFIFYDSVTVNSCLSGSQSINSQISATWGCENIYCQNSDIVALGNLSIANPLLSYVTRSSDLDVLCKETSTYSFTVKNTQTSSGNSSDFAYNLVIQLPFVNNASNVYNPANFPGTFTYDSVKINGISVPFTAGLNSHYPIVSPLTSANYNGGGLTDADNDGFIDDLQSDSSIKVEVFYRYEGPTGPCRTTTGRNPFYYYAHKGLYIDYDNMCGVPSTQFRTQAYYQFLDFAFVSKSSSSIANNGSPFYVGFSEWAQFSGFDFSKVRLEKRFIVPKGVSVSSPVNIIWNGVSNNGSVNYAINTKPGVTHDTISVTTDAMRGAYNSNDNFTLDFINDCSLNLDTCSDIIIDIESYVHIDNGNPAAPCYSWPISCGSVSILKNCDATHTGYNIDSVSLRRATFGWTDSNQLVKIKPTDAGVNLQKVHPYDSIRLDAYIFTKDTALDSLFFDLNYTHIASTTDPLVELPGAHKVTIKHGITGNSYEFHTIKVTKNTISSTEKTFVLNLSGLLDSMRIATGDPTFKFGGNTGSSTYRTDSIYIEYYCYANVYADYSINSNMVSYEEPSTKSAIPSCIFRGKSIEIDHEQDNGTTRFAYNDFESCSKHFYFSLGVAYRDAGSTHNPSTPIQPKFDPLEYKPFTVVDSIYVSWDENVYFLDTNEDFYHTRYYYGFNANSLNQNTLLLDKSLIRYISSNEIVIYTSTLPKRYGKGVRDHLQVSIPFRNSCGRDLSSTSTTHPDGNQRFTYKIYRKLYPQGIGGAKSADINGQASGSSAVGALPTLSISTTVPSADAIVDTLEWQFNVLNNDNSEMTPYTWIDFKSVSGGITPVLLSDGTKNYPLISYSGGLWAKIDTLQPNQNKTFILKGTFTSCTDDSLTIRTGYNCALYPMNPDDGYPTTGYVCNNNVENALVYLVNKEPLIQNLIVSQPSTTVDLCDTLDYVLRIQNSGEGVLRNLKQFMTLPPSTLLVVPGTSEVEWPIGNGTWVTIPNPNLISGTYEWDLSSINGGILPSANSTLDSNKINLRFRIETGCPFTSGDQLSFAASGEKLCGAIINSLNSASDPIIINGLPASPNTVLHVDIEKDTLNVCKTPSIGTAFLKNIVGNSTNGGERIILSISDTSINLTGPIFNVMHGNYLTSLVPHDTVISNQRLLEWDLVPGMPTGDSLSFDFSLSTIAQELTQCKNILIKFQAVEKHNIYCPSTSSLCVVNYPISEDFDSILVTKGELYTSFLEVENKECEDSLIVNFSISNSGADVDSNTTSITFVIDVNGNGIVDANDSVLSNQIYFIKDSINMGDSLSFSTKLYTPFDGCNIIAYLDSNNCSCSENEVLTQIKMNTITDSLVICALSSDSVPVCDSSQFSSSRTYTWSGISANALPSYLSATNVLKPLFSAPAVSVLSTYSYQVEIDNGSCTWFDTLIIIANPLPESFTTTDTIVCEGSSYQIQPDISQAGVNYSVWTMMIGGTELGNAPYSTSISSNSSFYLEATNSITGCNLFPRVPINLFLDTILPVIQCKNDTIYLNTLGFASVDTSNLVSSFYDNCTVDSVYLKVNGFNCIDTGENLVTIYIRDNNNNSDSCIATVTVLDTINPTVVCKDTTIYLDATGSFTIDTSFILSSVSDICGIDTVYISNDIFNCGDTGSNSVTIYALDVNENLDSCIATVTVLDTINPSVVCKDTTVFLDATGSFTIDTSFILSSVSDICGIDTVYISNNIFNCGDTGSNSVTIYALDVNGNLDSCIATVTVLDTINPTVICKDTTIYLDATGSFTIDTSFILNSVSDICGIDTVYISNDIFNCGDTGTNSVTIYALDVNGNLDSCIATVTVLDTINPTVICKDTTIYLDATGSFTIDTSFILNSVSDICGIDTVYISNNIFNCGDTGSNSVTIYALDVNGNLDSCIATVTVLDTINPSVVCKDTTIYLDATGSFTIDTSFILSSVSDICGIDTVYISNNIFNCGDTGSNSVTIYAMDVNGNLDSCIATVTVLDTINPSVVCKDTTIYLDATGSFTIDTSFILNSVSDICGIDTVYISYDIFNCGDTGTNSVTIYALDVNGNLDSCIATVTVLDTINPTVICKDTTIYLDATGSFTIDTSFILNSVSDICGIDTVYISNNIFNCGDTGTNSVTIYALDVNGNLDSCIATVTVLDTINPSVVCKDTTVFLDATGSFTIDTSFILNSVSDICGIDTVYISNDIFNCGDTGTNSVTIYALDVNGNLDSCIATVTVLDTINPTVVCKDTTIYLDATGSFTIDTSFILNSVSDICGIDTVYISNNIFNCGDTGTNSVTIFAVDVNGNLDSCIATVTVLDTINPSVVCKDTTIYLDATGSFTIDTSFILNSVSDICGIDTVYISNNIFNCGDTGTNSVTIYALDVNGNLDSCIATVTVLDTINPTVICKDTTIYLDATGSFTIDTSFILSSVSDICGIDTVYISNDIFNCGDTGTNSVTIYALDVNGNLDSCIATVTVLDTINPTVICKDTTIYLDATGSFTIDTSFILNSVSDICGIDTVYISNNIFNCGDTGSNSVTIYAMDVNGNLDSCIATVTVLDTINPTVICKNDVIYLDGTGSATIDTSNVVASFMDNCTVDTIYLSNYNYSCSDTGVNFVMIYIEDINGNIDSCQATVTVRDTLKPLVFCSNVTVYLNASGQATIDTSFVLSSFTSNCNIDSVYLSDTLFTCLDTGVNPVWVFVLDINGNIDSCMSAVTVLDTTSPIIICKDTVIYLDINGSASIDSSYVLNSFSDNCIVSNVTLSKSTFSCTDTGINSVLIIASDPSGNIDSCRSNVRVLDTILPTAICTNTTIFLDSLGLGSLLVSDLDGGSFDNCGIISTTISKSNFNCSDIGTNAVTLTVTDNSGNISTCTSTVTVIDDIAPIVTCPPAVMDTILLNDCKFVVPDYSLILNASDNCTQNDSLVYSQIPLPGTVIDFTNKLDDVSTLSVSISTTDKEMNQSNCNFDIKIGCRLNASVPQIFSPNGDGINDILYVYGRNFNKFSFIVYDRWGEIVFESNDPNSGWDGNFRGKPSLEGVYVYYFYAETDQLGDIIRKGDVTLVR